ncbi:CBS domain-containing protein [Desulfurococcaceae archaeon MEX13E-LK6-19]|nr:CBS domain-containing protein [Desulfurococcaceae archaeon MEX13E-LK6-19]
MKANDFMTKEFPLIDKNETLYHAYKVMEKHGVDKMVIYEYVVVAEHREERRLAGVITSRDIVQKLATQRTRLTTPSSLHVSSFMNAPVVYVTPSEDVVNILNIMVEKGYGILPVVENNDIVGVIYRENLLKLLGEDDTEVRVIMDTQPFVAKTTDRVLKVRDTMLKKDVSFMPVVDDKNDLVGYVTIFDVAYAIFKFQDIVPAKFRKERIMHLIVEDIMRFRPPTLRITDTVVTAASKILEKNSRGAIVLDEIGDIAGVVTIHRIIEHLYEKISQGK